MRRYAVRIDGQAFTIDVHQVALDRFEVTVGDATFEATIEEEGDLPGAAISPEIPLPEEAGPELPPRAFALPAPAPSAAARRPADAGPPASPRPAAEPAALPGASPAAGASPASRADTLAAPMPGVVLEVNVARGAVLRRGDPVLVLEAMKMRNTIRCPRDAVVLEVHVEAGQPVGPGDALVRLGPPG